MKFTNDKQLQDLVDDLQTRYGPSALAICADRLIRSERMVGDLAIRLERLQNKVAHGCTDMSCEECDE